MTQGLVYFARKLKACWNVLPLTDHGGASCQRCLGALEEAVGRAHAHDGRLQPCVDVDAPRHHQLPVGIDGPRATGNYQVFSDLSGKEIKISSYLATTLK